MEEEEEEDGRCNSNSRCSEVSGKKKREAPPCGLSFFIPSSFNLAEIYWKLIEFNLPWHQFITLM